MMKVWQQMTQCSHCYAIAQELALVRMWWVEYWSQWCS